MISAVIIDALLGAGATKEMIAAAVVDAGLERPWGYLGNRR
jgi:hypothetical protein